MNCKYILVGLQIQESYTPTQEGKIMQLENIMEQLY